LTDNKIYDIIIMRKANKAKGGKANVY
jgi:hypothetical protein